MPSVASSCWRVAASALPSAAYAAANRHHASHRLVAVLPNLFLSLTQQGQNQNFPFGGTAVLIMVGVGLETVKQIETQLNQRNYEGFLK